MGGGDRFRQVALYGIYRLPVRPPKSDSTEKCCRPGGPVRHPPGGGRDTWLCTPSTSGQAVQLSRSGGGLGPPSGVGALYVISARSVQFGTHSSVRHLWPVGGARPPEGWVALYAIYCPGGGSAPLRGVGALYVISARPVRSGHVALYVIYGPGGGLGPQGGRVALYAIYCPRGARPPEGCSVRHHPSFRISAKSQLLRQGG